MPVEPSHNRSRFSIANQQLTMNGARNDEVEAWRKTRTKRRSDVDIVCPATGIFNYTCCGTHRVSSMPRSGTRRVELASKKGDASPLVTMAELGMAAA